MPRHLLEGAEAPSKKQNQKLFRQNPKYVSKIYCLLSYSSRKNALKWDICRALN